MAFVALGVVGAALVAWLTLQLRAGPVGLDPAQQCPSCRLPMTPLTAGPSTDAEHVRSYDVLACPGCTNAVTMVHGTRSHWAYCPACQQRTLQTPCIRLPTPRGAPAEVEVHEGCHLCGYEAVAVVSSGGGLVGGVELHEDRRLRAGEGRGQVIPFPAERARRQPR